MTVPVNDYEKRKALGQRIYETKTKRLVEPQEKGKFVVIDLTTEDYAIGRDWGYTTQELLDRRPEAVLHSVKIASGSKIGPLPAEISG